MEGILVHYDLLDLVWVEEMAVYVLGLRLCEKIMSGYDVLAVYHSPNLT